MSESENVIRRRDGSVDLFRWICILSVLVHHSTFPSRQTQATLDGLYVAKEILSWCVTGFLFVSGWLSKPETFGLSSTLSRGGRLLRPFLAVNLVVCAIMIPLVQTGFVHTGAQDWTWSNILTRMIYLQGMGPQFYFLPYLFLVATLSLGTARWLGSVRSAYLWAALTVAVWAWIGLPEHPYGSIPANVPLYATVFSLGLCLKDKERSRWGIALAGAGLALGVALVVAGRGSTCLHAFLPVPLFFAVRALCKGAELPQFSRWSSGSLYLWHAPFIHPASHTLWHRTGIGGLAELVFSIATTIVVCQLIHLLLEKVKLSKYLAL